MKKKLEKYVGRVVRLNKAKVSQQAVIASLDDQLGLMVGWENGNAAQQAKRGRASPTE